MYNADAHEKSDKKCKKSFFLSLRHDIKLCTLSYTHSSYIFCFFFRGHQHYTLDARSILTMFMFKDNSEFNNMQIHITIKIYSSIKIKFEL